MRGYAGVAIVAFSQHSPRQVLLGLRNKEEGFGLWVLPGGKVERDESPEAAVCREALEEVGVILEDPVAVYHEWLPVCGPDGCLMLYYSDFVDPTVPKVMAVHEFSELRWFDCFNLPENMWESDRRAINRTIKIQEI